MGCAQSGTTIWPNTRKIDAPSIVAASSKASGMPRMNWRIKYIPSGADSIGRMRPA